MTSSRRAQPRTLLLASTSPFRRVLLARLGLPFETTAPQVDESPLPQEAPQDLVTRLAEAKARAGARAYPDALVIGSDQVACIDGEVLGKPGDRERAVAQLERAAGRRVQLYTGLCLLDAMSGGSQVACVPFRVHFRPLTRKQIEAYVDRERPFDCAGSFKSEGLGAALFERIDSSDPTALIGLPLIWLARALRGLGVDPLGPTVS
jgi:7-methyl-GTP pyrophosphatase